MTVLFSAAACCTHVGRRRSNQDAVVVRRLEDGSDLIAVADGMGGHAAGEVASAMALEVLIAELETSASLATAVAAANKALYQHAREHAEWQGMGTTLVVLLRSGPSYQIANVGDSRAYRVDQGAVRQLTRDHSFIAEAVQSGAMSAAEAAASPWRNALTRAIGTDASVEVDVFGPYPAQEPHVVVLCSDGLYKAVTPEVIAEYVLATTDLTTAVEALAALAFRRGSDDNITIAAVEFESLRRRPPTVTLPLPIQLQAGVRRSNGAAAAPEAPAGSAQSAVAAAEPAQPPHAGRAAAPTDALSRYRIEERAWLVLAAAGALAVLAAVAWLLI